MPDIALVASVNIVPLTNQGGTSAAINTTGADCLIISVASYSGGTPVSDSRGNTWVPLTRHTASSGNHQFWICQAPMVGGGHKFTIGPTYTAAIVYAFQNVGSFDAESGAGTTGAGPLASGSVLPTHDGALILTALAANTGATDSVAPAGFTQTTIPNAAGVHLQTSAAWMIQTTKASINPTWSWTAGSHDYTAVSTVVFVPGATVPAIGLKRVQSAKAFKGNNAIFDITFGVPPVVGNGVVVSLFTDGTGGTYPDTCSDNYGHVYQQAVVCLNGGTRVGVYWCPKLTATGDPFTITIQTANSSGLYWGGDALEIEGVGTGLELDQTATFTGTSTSPSTGNTNLLRAPQALAVAVMSYHNNMTSCTVQTMVPAWLENSESLSFGWSAGETDSRIFSGAYQTLQNCSWTVVGTPSAWAAAIATFRAPPQTTKWRLNFTESNHGSFLDVARVTMATVPGDPTLCVGGTATAKSVYINPDTDASKAFDTDPTTVWMPNGLTGSDWLQYEFATPVMIRAYSIQCGSFAPKSWTLDYWDIDGAIWIPIHTVTGETGWRNKEIRNWPLVSKMKWRIAIAASFANPFSVLSEVEFRGVVGGPNLAIVPDQVSADSTIGSPYLPPAAIDVNPATDWISDSTAFPHWWSYWFAGPVDIVEYLMQASASGGYVSYAPKTWTLEYWTGAAWQAVGGYSNQKPWSVSESRVFPVTGSVSADSVRITQESIEILTSQSALPREARVTQIAIETIISQSSIPRNLLVTQLAVEVLSKQIVPCTSTITQVAIEVLSKPLPLVRVTQSLVETLAKPLKPDVLLTQLVVETLIKAPTDAVVTQQVIETLTSLHIAGAARATQFVVETLQKNVRGKDPTSYAWIGEQGVLWIE